MRLSHSYLPLVKCYLDLHLLMQSVQAITTYIVSLIPAYGELYIW